MTSFPNFQALNYLAKSIILIAVISYLISPAKADDDLLTRIAAANPEISKNLRVRCASCHTFGEGESNRVGPNLWNIVGRPVASVVGFKYSKALLSVEGNWSLSQLDFFLKRPQNFAKGTRMNYSGIPDPDMRASMLLFLRNQSNNPIALEGG